MLLYGRLFGAPSCKSSAIKHANFRLTYLRLGLSWVWPRRTSRMICVIICTVELRRIGTGTQIWSGFALLSVSLKLDCFLASCISKLPARVVRFNIDLSKLVDMVSETHAAMAYRYLLRRCYDCRCVVARTSIAYPILPFT